MIIEICSKFAANCTFMWFCAILVWGLSPTFSLWLVPGGVYVGRSCLFVCVMSVMYANLRYVGFCLSCGMFISLLYFVRFVCAHRYWYSRVWVCECVLATLHPYFCSWYPPPPCSVVGYGRLLTSKFFLFFFWISGLFRFFLFSGFIFWVYLCVFVFYAVWVFLDIKFPYINIRREYVFGCFFRSTAFSLCLGVVYCLFQR